LAYSIYRGHLVPKTNTLKKGVSFISWGNFTALFFPFKFPFSKFRLGILNPVFLFHFFPWDWVSSPNSSAVFPVFFSFPGVFFSPPGYKKVFLVPTSFYGVLLAAFFPPSFFFSHTGLFWPQLFAPVYISSFPTRFLRGGPLFKRPLFGGAV